MLRTSCSKSCISGGNVAVNILFSSYFFIFGWIFNDLGDFCDPFTLSYAEIFWQPWKSTLWKCYQSWHMWSILFPPCILDGDFPFLPVLLKHAFMSHQLYASDWTRNQEHHNSRYLCKCFKGALDNFNIIPTFFSKKIEISISSEAYACKMTTC